MESTGNFVGKLATSGGAVFAADRVDEADSIVKFDDAAAELGRVALGGRVVDGPWSVAGGVLVQLDSDQIVLFDEALTQKWIKNVGNNRLACSPQEIGGQLALILQNGEINFLDPSSGDEVRKTSLGQPIVHPPTFADGKVFFSGMDGTVHVLPDGSR